MSGKAHRIVLGYVSHLAVSASFRSSLEVCVKFQFEEVCMHRTKSLRRCSIAVALAMALLAWPAISDAQLTTTTPTVVGDASAVREAVLGILGTTTTTRLAATSTL